MRTELYMVRSSACDITLPYADASRIRLYGFANASQLLIQDNPLAEVLIPSAPRELLQIIHTLLLKWIAPVTPDTKKAASFDCRWGEWGDAAW